MSSRLKHKVFSPARIWAITSNTFLELVRLKVFYFMLIFGMLVIGSSMVLMQFQFQEQFQVLKDVSLGGITIFTWLLAVLSTAMLLPKEIEDRTLYTILAKPVPRLEYLLGKLLGVVLLLAVATVLMGTLFAVVLYNRQQYVIELTRRSIDPAELPAAIAGIKAATFSGNLLPAIFLIYLKAVICAALTLMLSTFSSSWIFTVMVSATMYIIGYLQPMAREYWLHHIPNSPMLKIFFGLIAIIFPDFQLFTLVDDVVVGNAIPMEMFLKTTGLGFGYVFIYVLVGYLFFANKEL